MLNKTFKLPDMPRKGPEDKRLEKSSDEERYKRHQRLLDGEIDKQIVNIDGSVGALKRMAGDADRTGHKKEKNTATGKDPSEREAE